MQIRFHTYWYKIHVCRPHSPSAVSNLRIDCLTLMSKGFVCSASNGSLYVFEKTDDPTVFQEIRSVNITEDSLSPEEMGSGERIKGTGHMRRHFELHNIYCV